MKVWADFFDWVLPELPGCSQDMATFSLRSTAIDFIENSGLHIEDHDEIGLVEGEATYDLDPAGGYTVARIMSIFHGSQPILPKTPDELGALRFNWSEWSGAPAYYFQETPDSIRLVPFPTAEALADQDTLRLRVALRPSQDSEGIEDWIFEDWVDVITSGAKGRLMVMPGKPWTNSELGLFYQRQYASGLFRARAAAMRAMTRGPLRVSLRRFA